MEQILTHTPTQNQKELFADLHIHSRFSRACSSQINILNLVKWARVKGLGLLGTGDFQHPEWFKELDVLEERDGILWFEDNEKGFPFIWQTEISLMYSQDGKGRRVHLVVLAPSKEIVKQIIDYLENKGRLDYDGRPIFNMDCRDFVADMKEIDDKIEIIPAHAWTSWFGIFGSNSGFDSLKEAFQDQVDKIYAIETGLSSDPLMNWGIKELNNKSIVSFSDSHCVHPDTLINLEDDYILPISEIEDEEKISCADLKDASCRLSRKIQYTKIPSPRYLKKIEYYGGEIKVSDKHRFYVFEDNKIIEKFAFQLRKGDYLMRLAKTAHLKSSKIRFKIPDVDTYFSLGREGLEFIKSKREMKNFLQREIATKLGIHKDNYWKIEKGLIKVKKKFLEKIAKILDFNYDGFIKSYVLNSFYNYTFPAQSSIQLFELLGYLIGCFTIINRGQCLLLTDKNKEILEYYKKIIDKMFSCKCRWVKYHKQKSRGLFLPSHVAQFFKLNFPEAILKARELRIPRKIFSASLDEISGFLRGFFDAEGCVSHHGVDISSSNKLLLFQIDSLLKKFDIFSCVSLNQLEKIKMKYRHRLILYGENLRKFNEKINFNHSLKKAKLINYTKNLKINRRTKIKRFGDFILVEVKSIKDEPSNVDFLYDVAVEQYKNYIANQIMVHNSFWPWRLGRECTIFDISSLNSLSELSYDLIIKQIRENSFIGTVEVSPSYGKYHWDGHRNCGFSCSPEESKKLNRICPKCGNLLTIGVEYRVNELTNQSIDERENKKHYYTLLPLHELISLGLGIGINSKGCWQIFNQLIERFGNEFNVLLSVSKVELAFVLKNELLVELIMGNRAGNINVKPGFDGEYGIPLIRKQEEQKRLF